MQNAGQFGQGAASVHPPSQFVPSEPSPNGGSTTSSLRQFRKKDVEKNNVEPQQSSKSMSESHVARVAPHSHYPPNDAYRYPGAQFSGYAPHMKYSDTAETSQSNPMSTSVIQKPKAKEYMEMCNVQQPHLNNQQYSPEGVQYSKDPYQYKMAMHKDPTQVYPNMFKPESQYYQKEQHQYQQVAHHADPKFNPIMNQNMRKFNPVPADNPFLNKLSKLHPNMARSIISDHHLQDAQPTYQALDQRAMYAQQNHRYYSVPGGMHQTNPYPSSPNYAINPPHPAYTNYPSGACNYPRSPQVAPRYPAHMDRSSSPSRARSYPDGMHMSPMNYHAIHQKMGANYPAQYRGPEYAQHYQHRRVPQDCFPQTCRPPQYIQGHHQMTGQEMQELAENTVSPSDSLKKFIENWADEDQSAEIASPMEPGPNLRDKLREDAPPGTLFMINANDVQYFENNGVPIVSSENGSFQLSSDNYQYLNGAMVRIIEPNKEGSVDANGNQERVVNLQIMEMTKDAAKAHPLKEGSDKVVIHQNTVLNSSHQDQSQTSNQFVDSISCTKELVDKNCSPINLDQLNENMDAKLNELSSEDLSQNSDDSSSNPKSMPLIDFFADDGHFTEPKSEENIVEDSETNEVLKENCESVVFNQETVKNEPVCSDSEVEEKTEDRSSAEREENKLPTEKRKRIFSVDDIIHNIGSNHQKNNPQDILISCSEQTLTEFIQKEVEFSSLEQLSCKQQSLKTNEPEVLIVPGATALIKVAGELMEITVKVVDGKKVINVKPLSEAMTVVDCNQNYEIVPLQSVVDEDLVEINPDLMDTTNISNVGEPVSEINTEVESQEVKEEVIAQTEEVTEIVNQIVEESVKQAQSKETKQEIQDDCSIEIIQNQQIAEEVNTTETVKEQQDTGGSDEIMTDTPVSETSVKQEETQVQEVELQLAETLVKELENCSEDSAAEVVKLEECPEESAVEVPGFEHSPTLADGFQDVIPEPELESLVEETTSVIGDSELPVDEETVTFEDVLEAPITELDVTVDVPLILDQESIGYPLEDEVFIEEPPGHEVVVADPLEGFGVTDLISHSPEIPLEPVTTTELPPIEEPEKLESEQSQQDTTLKKEVITKLEVQILSPTSTNVEDHTSALITRTACIDNDLSATVATKAAKKQYEPDLQVQHSTVSSSKKEERPKSRKRSKQVKMKEEPERKRLKIKLSDANPTTKEKIEEEDEYVDFKELLRARKLKKLRKQQKEMETDLAKHSEDNVEKINENPASEPSVEKEPVKEAPKKRVSFSDEPSSTVKMHPKDPRRWSRIFPNQVLVPSVSELIEENGGGSAGKKRISLADYVSRKRKSTDVEHQEKFSKLENDVKPDKPSDIKPSFLIHSSDWEDSNSPVPTPTGVKEQCLIEDFSGLMKTNSTKPVIDVNELTPSENRKDRTLQEYKDRVDLQLNSLSIQIPKKPHQNRPPCNYLVKRFLNNEKLSKAEMDEIRKIVDYKKSMQQKNTKTSDAKNLDDVEEPEFRLHFRKTSKKASEESQKSNNCRYSVINRLGDDGQPKIIFKRNRLNRPTQQPVVELVKLDLDDLEKVKEKYNVTVRT